MKLLGVNKMERTFKEELELAKEHKINVLKLNIADEVNCQLGSYWHLESDLENNEKHVNELFERICEKVWHIYLVVDNTYSLANVVDAVIRLVMNERKPINEINKYMVIGYIQDNF